MARVVLKKWLQKKAEDIIAKTEQPSHEDLTILFLSGFEEEVERRFELVDRRFSEIDKRFEQVDKRFEQVDKNFEKVDKRFDRLTTIMMWGFGLVVTTQVGVFMKLLFL